MASASAAAFVCTDFTCAALDGDDALSATEFLEGIAKVADDRIEGMMYHRSNEIHPAAGHSFELELKAGAVRPVSDAIAKGSEDENDAFGGMDMVFKGYAIFVHFAGDKGQKHLTKGHLHNSIAKLDEAFAHSEQTIVILRTGEGLCFIVTHDGLMDEKDLQRGVRDTLQVHYTDDGEEEVCKELEVAIFNVQKEMGAVEQRLPQFKRLQEWAEDCASWYYRKYMLE